ncbi:P-loop NTPase family protein [Sphingomonas hengshuiensis]|uniref:Chromosomal replication initiator protein DnaA n=1 Tax=Sphingomonas hengshuiensis TaxID=1609977 RepID=A0A7U4J7B4_9SPHN|nr:chromosomal replication initiator protein DnaA [Sphingomonas hengshuiensis]AJP71583.1 chromosomal replication initiator protein DnaA [Sphingomonas hengshuiensis]
MTQLRLPLGMPEARETEFLVGESNVRAVHQLERWATWPVRSALLVGPRKSGRSLLARVFAAKSGGRIFDDADRAKEADVFHAWNEAQQERRPLLIVAEAAPPHWPVKLPDLRSRLAASPLLELGPPDDVLIPQLIERAFERHLIHARPDVIAWLAKRVERSHIAILRVADALEAEAGHRLSIPVVKAALAASGLLTDTDES